MAKPLVIEELYAFVADNPDVGEGLMAFSRGGQWMPMVGADMARIESLIPIADSLHGRGRYRVLRFSLREDITARVAPGPGGGA